MTHANAPLTPVGRLRLARLIVDDGWPLRRAAERFQVSPATASRWAGRYRAGESMADLSSRPRRSPGRCSRRVERRIVALRFRHRWGPHRISYHLGVPRSTVGRVLQRYSMPLLQHLELDDERKETAAAFWLRANDFFATAGITVEAVMTDNGACYRSRDFAAALGTIRHIRTRPYRPQTNGKVERFNRTITDEWAYDRLHRSDQARTATYADWIHHYNHHRPHTGIAGLTPSARVHNLTGNYT